MQCNYNIIFFTAKWQHTVRLLHQNDYLKQVCSKFTSINCFERLAWHYQISLTIFSGKIMLSVHEYYWLFKIMNSYYLKQKNCQKPYQSTHVAAFRLLLAKHCRLLLLLMSFSQVRIGSWSWGTWRRRTESLKIQICISPIQEPFPSSQPLLQTKASVKLLNSIIVVKHNAAKFKKWIRSFSIRR